MEKILFRQAIAQKIFVSALISRNTRIQIYDGAFSPPLMRELHRSPLRDAGESMRGRSTRPLPKKDLLGSTAVVVGGIAG